MTSTVRTASSTLHRAKVTAASSALFMHTLAALEKLAPIVMPNPMPVLRRTEERDIT
jgi:hypothetical protein